MILLRIESGSQAKKRRDVSGLLVLDKPAGMSSNAVLQYVKRLYHAKKAGHTGSLDVLATGLLPICLGEATKIAGYLLESNKVYQACGLLGVTTSTGDASGTITGKKRVAGITRSNIERVLRDFIGEIEQVPPMYSALKRGGKRLYELAYKGIEVERAPRSVTVGRLELIAYNCPEFEIEVSCSKGTYIRVLCEDIGRRLGPGAHVLNLRRLCCGPFIESQGVTPEQLERASEEGKAALDTLLLPMDTALTDYPAVYISEAAAHDLYQGRVVTAPDLPKSGHLRLYDHSEVFMGLGFVTQDWRVAPKRLIKRAKIRET